MSVTLTFNTFGECKPDHDQEVIWLEGVNSFGATGFQPRHITVEYTWFEVGEDGYDTGTQVTYDGEKELEQCRLGVLFGGYEADDDTLWMSLNEYWKALGFEQ